MVGARCEAAARDRACCALRKELGVYANLRPVRRAPCRSPTPRTLKAEVLRGVDLVFVRELTGGIYFGAKTRTADRRQRPVQLHASAEIERVTRVAGRLAQARRGKLTSVDKANVLETSRLWREVVTRVMQRRVPRRARSSTCWSTRRPCT